MNSAWMRSQSVYRFVAIVDPDGEGAATLQAVRY